jgi:hypothetical protein
MKCQAYDHEELERTEEGCPYCGNTTLRFFEGIAESITKRWASFDRSPRRAEIKEALRIAVASAVTEQLIITNDEERRGVGAKWR